MSVHKDMHWVGSTSSKGNVDKTAVFVDWRDTAITCIEWAAIVFIGLLFGGFTSSYWDWPIWAAVASGAVITVTVGWAKTRITKLFI